MSLKVQNKKCDNCGSEFTLRWDDENEYNPDFCPFCSEEMVEDEDTDLDDDYFGDDEDAIIRE